MELKRTLASLLIILPALMGYHSLKAQGPTRPNIVIFEPDDLDPVTLHAALARGLMPNLQNYLVSTGMTFQTYYVTDARGCPTREGYFNGKYFHNLVSANSNHQCGVFQFDDTQTLAVWLHNAGYTTAFIGKYMDGYGYQDVNKDGVVDRSDATYIPPGWDQWASMPFYQPVVSGSIPPPGVILPQDNPNQYDYYLTSGGNLVYHGTSPSDYQTDVLSTIAVNYVNRVPVTKPIFLTIAPGAPHIETNYSPHGSPGGYQNEFAWDIRPSPTYTGTVQFPLPQPPSFNPLQLPGKPQWDAAKALLTTTDIANLTSQWDDRLAALRSVDDLIGSVINALAARGLASNTVFLFYSDNGWMYGNWRLGGKLAAYDPSIGAPLIVSVGPSVQATVTGSTTRALTVSTDIVPTVLDFAGVPAPYQLDGTSFRPVLSNPKTAWRNRCLVEHWTALGGNSAVYDLPNYKAVRTAVGYSTLPNQLFVAYPTTGEKEFYDYTLDPYAMTNLAINPSPGHQRQLQKLLNDLNALAACSGSGCHDAEWRP